MGVLDKQLNILWEPTEKQQDALCRNEFEILYGGSRGGGKTDAGLVWLLYDHNHPRFRALVIRKNADDLKDWIDRARRMYAPVQATVLGQPVEIRFPNGGVIRTGHLKDDNAYEKYQGHEYQKMLIEELTQIPSEENYLKLISSCRSLIPEIMPQVFATTNPGGAGHGWVKKRFINSTPGVPFLDPVTNRSRIFIPARIHDNPYLLKGDPGYIAFLDGLPDGLRKAWKDGNWDVFAGQYFTEWNSDHHVIQPFQIPESWLRIRCLDYGHTNPSACYWLAIDFDGKIYVYRELYESGLTYKALAQKILAMTPEDEIIDYTVADTSMFAKTQDTGEYGHDIMAVNGVPITPANKDRINGWNLFREYLSSHLIFFFSNCVKAITEIPNAIHDDRNVEDLKKVNDHALDAIRYGLMSVPPVPIQPVQTNAPKDVYKNDPSAPWFNEDKSLDYNKLYS